ncbi:hypothetical protein GIB67_018346 [Kingdonia uniflora]|uniref:RNase H type-1 domain-containing protein n=1 Tax=Kingdonia uniflora TaxID=39325 RepID=A0A7J7MJ24_9MAGN|nr:hypothetical protein GIB67_018346 [Kingdonia uniflora]
MSDLRFTFYVRAILEIARLEAGVVMEESKKFDGDGLEMKHHEETTEREVPRAIDLVGGKDGDVLEVFSIKVPRGGCGIDARGLHDQRFQLSGSPTKEDQPQSKILAYNSKNDQRGGDYITNDGERITGREKDQEVNEDDTNMPRHGQGASSTGQSMPSTRQGTQGTKQREASTKKVVQGTEQGLLSSGLGVPLQQFTPTKDTGHEGVDKGGRGPTGINEYWKKHAFFCTLVKAHGKRLDTIIVGGSSDNLIVADKLRLNLVPHPKVATMSWLHKDGNPGKGGLAFIIIDSEGNVLRTGSVGLGVTTSFIVECKAIIHGVKCAALYGLLIAWNESNSAAAVMVFKSGKILVSYGRLDSN